MRQQAHIGSHSLRRYGISRGNQNLAEGKSHALPQLVFAGQGIGKKDLLRGSQIGNRGRWVGITRGGRGELIRKEWSEADLLNLLDERRRRTERRLLEKANCRGLCLRRPA